MRSIIWNSGFALYLICTVVVFSCKQPRSSLTESSNKELVQLMNYGFELVDNGQLDSALHIFQRTKRIQGSKTNKAMCFNALGNIYYHKHEYVKALEEYLESVLLFQQVNDQKNTANTEMNAGLCFKKIGIHDKASEYITKAISFFEKDTTNNQQLIMGYTLLGNIYSDIENQLLSVQYHQKALKLLSSRTGMSVAPPYNNLGNTYYKNQQYDSALVLYQTYLKITKNENDSTRQGRAYQNLAKTYLQLGRRAKCKEMLDSAFLYYSYKNYLPGLLLLNIVQSQFHLSSNNELAIKHAQEAVTTSRKLHKLLERQEALEILHQALNENGQFQKAYDVAIEYITLSKTINDKEKLGQIYTYEMMGKIAVKNDQIAKEIQKQKFEKTLRYIAMFLALLLIIVILLIYRRYQEGKQFIKEYFSSETGVILKNGKKIEFDQILRIETIRNDLIIIKATGEKITEKNTTLKSFIPSLPKINFGRPQRGIIINFSFITKVWKTKIDLLEESINISPKFSEEFLDQWEKFTQTKSSKEN